jgi:hypothetical protein
MCSRVTRNKYNLVLEFLLERSYFPDIPFVHEIWCVVTQTLVQKFLHFRIENSSLSESKELLLDKICKSKEVRNSLRRPYDDNGVKFYNFDLMIKGIPCPPRSYPPQECAFCNRKNGHCLHFEQEIESKQEQYETMIRNIYRGEKYIGTSDWSFPISQRLECKPRDLCVDNYTIFLKELCTSGYEFSELKTILFNCLINNIWIVKDNFSASQNLFYIWSKEKDVKLEISKRKSTRDILLEGFKKSFIRVNYYIKDTTSMTDDDWLTIFEISQDHSRILVSIRRVADTFVYGN